MGCHALLQGIFPTQGSNSGLLHWQAGSSPLDPPGKSVGDTTPSTNFIHPWHPEPSHQVFPRLGLLPRLTLGDRVKQHHISFCVLVPFPSFFPSSACIRGQVQSSTGSSPLSPAPALLPVEREELVLSHSPAPSPNQNSRPGPLGL